MTGSAPASATGVALDGYRSLQLMQDLAVRRRRPPGLAALPARAQVQKVPFIEFAASDEEAASLGAMLSALGFRASGQHRRKSVTRWTQGDINLIVNCEPEGFAHTFDVVHGASVCAIGLSVANVTDALQRAEGLSIPRFTQAVGPDEMQIPSVRGVGGSLIYFIEAGSEADVWKREFIPVETPATAATLGLTDIDHIAQTMRYEEFLSWLLYYVALFDVSKTPQVEIADPLGLVQSQAIESADRSLRITLNGSMGEQTLTSRFVQPLHGRRRTAHRVPDAGRLCRRHCGTRERPAELWPSRPTTTTTSGPGSAWKPN